MSTYFSDYIFYTYPSHPIRINLRVFISAPLRPRASAFRE